jgi:hypothetical protein
MIYWFNFVWPSFAFLAVLLSAMLIARLRDAS